MDDQRVQLDHLRMVVESLEDGFARDGRREGGRSSEDGALHGCDWDLVGILYSVYKL